MPRLVYSIFLLLIDMKLSLIDGGDQASLITSEPAPSSPVSSEASSPAGTLGWSCSSPVSSEASSPAGSLG